MQIRLALFAAGGYGAECSRICGFGNASKDNVEASAVYIKAKRAGYNSVRSWLEHLWLVKKALTT